MAWVSLLFLIVLAFTQVEKPCEVPSGLDFRAFADGLCGQGKS